MRSRRLLILLTALSIAAGTSACSRTQTAGPAGAPSSAGSIGTSQTGSTGTVAPADGGSDGQSGWVAASGNGCELAQSGDDVRIQVTAADTDFCTSMALDLSRSGAFWTVRPQAATPDGMQLICVMTSPDGPSAAVVDTGGAVLGRGVCSGMLTAGWHEDTQREGQIADAAAAARASAASASVNAQAQADAAASLARDEDSANTALAAVKAWPATLAQDNPTMDEALRKVEAALAQTRDDAAKGQGDACDNVQTVTYDAQQNVGYEATQGVGYEATQTVGYHVTNARSDLDHLDQALAALAAHPGSSEPPGVREARGGLNRAVAAAISYANSRIDKANADASSAYQVANKLVSGSCSGGGPGRFDAVAHIS